MKKIFIFTLVAASSLFANTLVVTNGSVKAHTEVFGDSTIDPSTKSITSHLQMDDTIESLKGSVDVSVRKLKSDNETRDEHMVEALESNKYPVAHYTFGKVSKTASGYTIDGILKFHNVERPLKINARIIDNGNSIEIKGKGKFKLSSYNVKPIRLLLLTVRDRIDLNIDVKFKKQ
ncbi:YceI family protein [Sulfurovum riftiae]|uniref:Lipid/polyisoprenoid-binding YceI-like domain-containing protein n=1 Tax=Sulfurovum riftiae TaxID=1630136 RepID=A0A151CEA0_9BACT|nr:YceI family protein [Sulfurovum riftiae]KYJ85845.1 hypothetical protein AS592_04440 [Sulfurovum riftiae]